MGPTEETLIESKDNLINFDNVDLTRDDVNLTGDAGFEVINAGEAGPVKEVGPWKNAYQHTRTAAGNVYIATRRFSDEVYNSGLGRASGAVFNATFSSLQLARRHFRYRSPVSGTRELIARDILGDPLSNTALPDMDGSRDFEDPQQPIARCKAIIETVPILDSHSWPGDREITAQQGTQRIAGPAQRRLMLRNTAMMQSSVSMADPEEDLPMLISHPQSLPASHAMQQTSHRPPPLRQGRSKSRIVYWPVQSPRPGQQRDQDGFISSPTTSGFVETEPAALSHKAMQLEEQPREYGLDAEDTEDSEDYDDDEFFGFSEP